jgi:CRP-like cAMP-binding protein
MAAPADTTSIVKDKAEAFFARGAFREALDAYGKISRFGDRDPRIYLRIGDIHRKLGSSASALDWYKKAADSFGGLGFLIKAIAVCKMIIGMDPSQDDVQARLAALCARTQGAPPAAPGDGRKASAEEAAPVAPAPRLPRTPLFSDLSETEFLHVLRKVRAREMKAGSFLFRKGDAGDSIFFVAEGEVEVEGSARDGSPVRLARLKDGAVFGEFGFFLKARRAADVRATVDSTVLELTKADLEGIIAGHARVAEVLLEFYKERVVDRLMALSEVFRPMSEDDRREVLKRLKVERHSAGALIMKEGHKGDTMCLIKEGGVSVWIDEKGGGAPLAALGEGDFFGEIALATSRPRVANVTAATDVELMVFSRPMIKDILVKYPSVKGVLERVIKERIVDVISAREMKAALV